MDNNEKDEEDSFNVERRNTIHKLEDFIKDQNEQFKKTKEKESTIPKKSHEDNVLLKKEIRKSIAIPNLGEDKEIFTKLEQFISKYNEKHKNINYEKVPDYLDKKEDNSQLIKSCKNEIYKDSIELPLIIFENKYFDEFSNFLDNYIKYKEYKVIYILKDKLLIRNKKINNYDIFHKEKENKEINNDFIAETISNSMVNLYSEEQIKDIRNSLGILSKNFKENLKKEIEKWVGTIFDIISDYILFKLKEKPLYYCCDICKMPILFKEKSIESILKHNEIVNNNNNENIIDTDNAIKNQIIDENEENLKKKKVKKLIEEKKKKDKEIIKNTIKTKNDIKEYKNLFKVANTMINLINFDKFNTQNENHNLANPPKKTTPTGDELYNNLLFYTDNKYADFELLEREVSGAFILVTDKNSLEYVMKCLKNNSNNDLTRFILLLSGKCCEKILQFLDENNYLNDFISCIIFTKNKELNYLSNNYNKIKGIFKTKKQIINYLNNNEDQKTPYFTFKLINLKKYFDYYFEFHKKISLFYGQLSQNLFESKINVLKDYLNTVNQDDGFLINALNVFQNGIDGKVNIIKGYTGSSFYQEFNRWLYSLDSLALEKTGYFLSGLSYSLDLFGEEKKTGVNQEITLYRGVALSYINLLPYKNNIGNIITFPNFISSSTSLDTAKGFAYSGNSNEFTVIFTIKYRYKDNWVPNAVFVDDISACKGEEERLFQCYSFFIIKSVKIDIDKKTADIDLETIGRTSILEEEIKKGKKIRYNYKEGALEAYS